MTRGVEMERSSQPSEHRTDPFLFERVEQVLPNLGRPAAVGAADQCGCGYCYCHGGGCNCAMCLAMPAELPQITERVIAARTAIGEPAQPLSVRIEEEQ